MNLLLKNQVLIFFLIVFGLWQAMISNRNS